MDSHQEFHHVHSWLFLRLHPIRGVRDGGRASITHLSGGDPPGGWGPDCTVRALYNGNPQTTISDGRKEVSLRSETDRPLRNLSGRNRLRCGLDPLCGPHSGCDPTLCEHFRIYIPGHLAPDILLPGAGPTPVCELYGLACLSRPVQTDSLLHAQCFA